jgi:hypothetical protein
MKPINALASLPLCFTLLLATAGPLPAQTNMPSRATGSEGRKAVAEKLERIQVDLPMGRISLTNLVHTLAAEARRLDPEARGVNFILNAQGTDLHEAFVRLDNGLIGHLTLAEALKVIVTLTDRPILYTIEDYGVIIAPRSAGASAVQTRVTRANPDTFRHGLEAISGAALMSPGAAATGPSGPPVSDSQSPLVPSALKSAPVSEQSPRAAPVPSNAPAPLR